MSGRAGIVALLFTDLANSRELLERAGDEATQGLLRAHYRLLKTAVGMGGDREVKWLGDGWMVPFRAAVDAVRCAIAMQQAAQRRAVGTRLAVRVGLNVGEVLTDETDYLGTPVLIARQLCDLAQGGQILCTDLVAGLLEGCGETFPFADRRVLGLKGIAAPVPVSELLYRQEEPTALLTETPFVGRAAELTKLAHRLQEMQAGKGGLVLLVGEAGIGKTRTAEEFAEMARDSGALVLSGHCYQGEWAPPYAPFAEALGEWVRGADTERLRAHVQLAGSTIARLVPDLRERLPDLEEPPPLRPDEERSRIFDAASRLVESIAARDPLVLLLDDLHWADETTLALLGSLTRLASQSRLLLLGAYRDMEVDREHLLSGAINTLRREPRFESIALTGLAHDGVRELLEIVAGHDVPETFVEAVHGASSGNPFFVRELLLHLVREGRLERDAVGRWTSRFTLDEMRIPQSVRALLDQRLGRVSEEVRRLLSAASAWEGGFPFEVASRAAGLEDDAALDALDEALQAQLVWAPDADRYEFGHALIRHMLYDELAAPRRIRLHRRLAEAAEAVYGAAALTHAAEIAVQYHRSRELPGAERGVPYCLAAADGAAGTAAFAEQIAFLRRALELLPPADARRPRILGQLGLALAWSGAAEDTVRIACDAGEHLAASEGTAAAADYLADVSAVLWGAAFVSHAWAVAAQGLRHAGDRHDTTWAVLISHDLDRREAEDPARPGISLDAPERHEAWQLIATTWEASGRPPRNSPPRLANIYGKWVVAESRREVLERWPNSAVLLSFVAGEYRRALEINEREIADGLAIGRVASVVWDTALSVRLLVVLGEFDPAERALERATELAGRAEQAPALALLLGSLHLELALVRGEADYVLAPAIEAILAEDPPENRSAVAPLHACAALGHALSGNAEQALRLLDLVIPAVERAPVWAMHYVLMTCHAAKALWIVDRSDSAAVFERNLRTKVLPTDFRHPMVDARLALAWLCALTGRFDEASAWFAQARRVLEEQGARPLRATVDFDEALMYVRRGASGDPQRAAPLLDLAEEQFRAIGMTGWIRRAEQLRKSIDQGSEGRGGSDIEPRPQASGARAQAEVELGSAATGPLSGSVVCAPKASRASDTAMQRGGTLYARAPDGASLAYQIVGSGPRRLVCMLDWATHVEEIWNDPCFARFARRLGSITKILLFDKRGVGLSDPVSLADLPTLESWTEDVAAVMDAAGWQDAALLAADAAGPMSMLFAATHPQRTTALILCNTAARLRRAADYPAGMPEQAAATFLSQLELGWGSSVTLDVMNPSVSRDPTARSWQARYQRQTASPGAMVAMARTLLNVDVRSVLPAISAPTLVLHRSGNQYYRVAHGRYLAERIARARYVELPGADHTITVGDQSRVLDEVEEFLTGVRPRPELERVLATVLFTDIVDSTKTVALRGDRDWHELITAHNDCVASDVARFRGRLVKTTGDGIVATFDGPARAIRAACAIRASLRGLRLDVRAGIHTGEIQLAENDLVGLAVHIAQRVCAAAHASEIWVSNTVVDLVVGGGIDFHDRGEYELKGVPGRRRLYVVAN